MTSQSQASSVNGDSVPKSSKIPKKAAEEEYTIKTMLNAMSEALETNFEAIQTRMDELSQQLGEIKTRLDEPPPAAAPAQIVLSAPGFKPPYRRGRGGAGGGGGRGSYNGSGRFPRL